VLNLQKCRSLLGTDCNLTDSELEQLRRELYALSDVALEAFSAQQRAGTQAVSSPSNGDSCITAIPEAERGDLIERAAILEFDAGLSRPEAERQAFGEWAQKRQPPNKRQEHGTRKKRGNSFPLTP